MSWSNFHASAAQKSALTRIRRDSNHFVPPFLVADGGSARPFGTIGITTDKFKTFAPRNTWEMPPETNLPHWTAKEFPWKTRVTMNNHEWPVPNSMSHIHSWPAPVPQLGRQTMYFWVGIHVLVMATLAGWHGNPLPRTTDTSFIRSSWRVWTSIDTIRSLSLQVG